MTCDPCERLLLLKQGRNCDWLPTLLLLIVSYTQLSPLHYQFPDSSSSPAKLSSASISEIYFVVSHIEHDELLPDEHATPSWPIRPRHAQQLRHAERRECCYVEEGEEGLDEVLHVSLIDGDGTSAEPSGRRRALVPFQLVPAAALENEHTPQVGARLNLLEQFCIPARAAPFLPSDTQDQP